MSPDFKDLLSILNADNVIYLVVGGYAVSLHARQRRRTFFRALAKFGAPLEGLAPDDFTQAAAQVKILQRLGGAVAQRRKTLEWQ